MAQDLVVSAPQDLSVRKDWRKAIKSGVRRILSVVGLLCLWALVSAGPWNVPIPSPLASLRALSNLQPATLAVDIALSCRRVGLGFVLATVVAVPLGILAGYSKWIYNIAFPLIEMLRPIPPIAWIPLAILFFPSSESMVVFLTFLGAFFPIAYNTLAGFWSIKPMYLRAGKSLGAGEWRLFWQVILPGMMPVIFAGLQVAVGVSWLMVVAGEMMAAKGGVGAMTWQAYQTARYPLIFVGMAIIGILGFLSSYVVRKIGNSICRWEMR
jgi:NitT/TauT family transport system permease protein